MNIRPATAGDLPEIVRLLADDPLGAGREDFADPLPHAYGSAFDAIGRQEGNQILVAITGGPKDGGPRDGGPKDGGPNGGGRVAGCLQLTFIPGLARLGMTRALIEAVRVDRHCRGEGIGEALFHTAIELAREAGCGLVQLTSDKSRSDAHRFYERLGFVASHEGMKLSLEP